MANAELLSVFNEKNVVSAAYKAHRMLFCQYKIFNRPLLDYWNFKALEKNRSSNGLAMASMKQLSNRFDHSLLPTGGSVVIEYPYSRLPHGLLDFPMESIQPAQGYVATPICFQH